MRKRNPLLGVSLRLLVAGYLLYIAYVQFSSIPTTDHVGLSVLFGILFAAVGVFFAIWAIFAYRQDTRPQPKDEESKEEPQPDQITAEAAEETEETASEAEAMEGAESEGSAESEVVSEETSQIHEVSEEELEE